MNALDGLEGVWSNVMTEAGPDPTIRMMRNPSSYFFLPAESPDPLRGCWGSVSYDRRGGNATVDRLRRLIAHGVSGQPMPLERGDYIWAAGIFHIDPSNQIKVIDFEHHWGGHTLGTMQQGIYRLEGDQLLLCLAGSGKSRPISFSSNAQMDIRLLVLQREG